MATATLTRPEAAKNPPKNLRTVPAGLMTVPIVGSKSPKVGDRVSIDAAGTNLMGLDERARPNSVGLMVGAIRAIDGNQATIQILQWHPASALLQEMASASHLQIESDNLPGYTSSRRAVLRLSTREGQGSMQESNRRRTPGRSLMESAAADGVCSALAAEAVKCFNSDADRATKIKRLRELIVAREKAMGILGGKDAESVEEFQTDDRNGGADEDAPVEEDLDMPTPGESGPLAESLIFDSLKSPSRVHRLFHPRTGNPLKSKSNRQAASLLESVGFPARAAILRGRPTSSDQLFKSLRRR
jgi:hypothetical protein